MKRMVSVAIVLVLAALTLGTPAMAFEASADAYVGVYSTYLWRGYDLNEEDDNFVVQPGVDVSVGDFTVSFWSNISENSGEMNEVDVTLDYSTDLSDLVSVSVGNILYNVDDDDADTNNTTNELYLGVTLNTILEPTLTVYYDYDEFESIYTTLGIGHGFELSDAVSLSLGATASYLSSDNDDAFDDDTSWFHNYELSAGVDYAVNENITISGLVLYSAPLSDDAEDDDKGMIDEESTVGVSIAYAF